MKRKPLPQLDLFSILPGESALLTPQEEAAAFPVAVPQVTPEKMPTGGILPVKDIASALGYPRYEPTLALAAVAFTRAVQKAGYASAFQTPGEPGKPWIVDWKAVARLANGILRGVASDRPQLTVERFTLAITGVEPYGFYWYAARLDEWTPIETGFDAIEKDGAE